MNHLALAAFLAMIPTVALCQPAASSVPPPGTIEDPKAEIKSEADGPPNLSFASTCLTLESWW